MKYCLGCIVLFDDAFKLFHTIEIRWCSGTSCLKRFLLILVVMIVRCKGMCSISFAFSVNIFGITVVNHVVLTKICYLLGCHDLGNFVCDIMVASTEADFALLNAGTFRSDTLHPSGPFTMKDLLLVLPFISPMVLIEVTEKQILECLENGVSQ